MPDEHVGVHSLFFFRYLAPPPPPSLCGAAAGVRGVPYVRARNSKRRGTYRTSTDSLP